MDVYLGIDVGSVTTKCALVTERAELIAYNYLRTQGRPVAVVQQGLRELQGQIPADVSIRGVCTTGSARYLAGVIVGADVVKNEITAQSMAALHYVPDVRTVIEIGGQDSKLILIRDGMVVDFAMNTVCAAGTGSFLDQQASRLNMRIEDFGELALQSGKPVHIAGRCTVFAESDMIHKQQMGYEVKDIIYGLCQALVRNYLNDVGQGKEIQPPIVFQGGVAFNKGIILALEESLGTKLIIPPHHEITGAFGAALIARDEVSSASETSSFKGFEVSESPYRLSSFECRACPLLCDVAQVSLDDRVIAFWGGRCDLGERIENG
ncbi:MAG: 2-hydroxyglutaryl-CoA dehydratase [Chloroflexi bacterium RBG_13_52_14]|nr:MAG: 2-hydroxyglutaryl-CoA dehydratase [Chloroflexi bacterium RBG_13_52_14]